MTGKIYLIPTPLASETLHILSPEVIRVIHSTRYFIVENARTARRFIKSTAPPYAIETLHIIELDKHKPPDPASMLSEIFKGENVGIMSEAGCPGIADPGSVLVQYAHVQGIQVVPLAGPSSIFLALMASGLNGQRFQFHGYLSPKKERLGADLRKLEELSRKDNATQIFIETPYRNQQVFETALKTLAPETMFCIAVDLTSEDEFLQTKPIHKWKNEPAPEMHKHPAVFCVCAV